MLVKVKRWALEENWSPMSPLQVKDYLRSKGYQIPRHRTRRDKNGERSETTDDESLQELQREGKPAFGDKVLEKVLDARHTRKALGYLSEKFVISGRMHPIWTVKPKSGRLSAARPNLTNLPKGKKGLLMKRASEVILSSIVADPGYILFSADWKAIEPQLIGFFAGDANYARLGRIGGSHTNVLSHYIGKPANLEQSDEELMAEFETLKAAHKDAYALCKTGNMAYLYLQGVMNMAKTLGLSVPRTKEIRAAIDASAPLVKKWKYETLKIAHFQGRLTNPFGFSMSYFEIFQVEGGKVVLDNDGLPKLGKEAMEAISFPAQSTGAAMLRKALVHLGNREEEGFQLLASEHDKILGQARPEDLDRVLSTIIVPFMSRKWPELNGLSIDVDVEVGPSWQGLKSWEGKSAA